MIWQILFGVGCAILAIVMYRSSRKDFEAWYTQYRAAHPSCSTREPWCDEDMAPEDFWRESSSASE